MTEPLEHHVENFISDNQRYIGWHCLTCGHDAEFAASQFGWAAVEDDAEQHRRSAREYPGSFLPRRAAWPGPARMIAPDE